jgi:SAM-dependent methyltransferase
VHVTASEPRLLAHSEGEVRIDELDDERRRVSVTSADVFVSSSECVTRYPVDLIEKLLAVKGPGYLCNEIERDEDSGYVELFLRYSILGYLPERAFDGARMLDFGSGSGASTAILARMFPAASLAAVELEPAFVEIAEARAEHYGLENLETLVSPDPSTLPDGIGQFDFVNLSAVYEHLLPEERRQLLPQLWSVLKTGGVLFVSQLPHRFYPIEQHTTGLPLINYLPARPARAAAARSRRIDEPMAWPDLLRAGIRGGTKHRSSRTSAVAAASPSR